MDQRRKRFANRGPKSPGRLARDVEKHNPTIGVSLPSLLQHTQPPCYPEDWEDEADLTNQESIQQGACPHEYVLKTDQCNSGDKPPYVWRVCAVCHKCRQHLQLTVTKNSQYDKSCHIFADPNHQHHYLYQSGQKKAPWTDSEVLTSTGQVSQLFNFACSYKQCETAVEARFTSPLINAAYAALLVDQGVINQRAAAAIAARPDRLSKEDMPSPMTVVNTLRLLLENALHAPEKSRAIVQGNKRFMASFGVNGEPCRELLEFLGFRQRETNGPWEPPHVRPAFIDQNLTNTPTDPARARLDDAIHELICLIDQIAEAERIGAQPIRLPEMARRATGQAIRQALGAENEENESAKRVKVAHPPKTDEAWEVLGVVRDDHIDNIILHFDHSLKVNPDLEKQYTEHLNAIGEELGGGDKKRIDDFLADLREKKPRALSRFEQAWEDLGLAPANPIYATHALVTVGLYNRIAVEPEGEDKWRMALDYIGIEWKSMHVQRVARLRLNDIQGAYEFMAHGCGDDTDDATIDDLRAEKDLQMVNNPSDYLLTTKAVLTIAHHRKSKWLADRVDPFPMDPFFLTPKRRVDLAKQPDSYFGENFCQMTIQDAYHLMRVSRGEKKDDAFYAFCRKMHTKMHPQWEARYKKAITRIADDRNSSYLRDSLDDFHPTPEPPKLPVGLANIGNTCYLNSLLQFYFSVVPFRNMVLNIADHQMDLNNEGKMREKLEGSRAVTNEEVAHALHVIRELKNLFEDMIKNPDTAVTPTEELVRMTLIRLGSLPVEDSMAETVSPSLPHGLGEIDGVPVAGPLLPVSHHQVTQIGTTQQSNEGSDNTSRSQVKPPKHAPPVPPRSTQFTPAAKPMARVDDLQMGDQQDVTEIINNVLLQSQRAIQGDGFTRDGEQLDLITKTFYGSTVSYIKDDQGTRDKEERWWDIKVNVANGPRNIYEALDDAFDVQEIDIAGGEAEQYGAIRELPPVLQIQVQRAQYDSQSQRAFKSHNHLELLETIYMDRYMSACSPSLDSMRRKCWDLKKELAQEEAQNAELSKSFLREDGVARNGPYSAELAITMEKCSNEQKAALEESNEKIQTKKDKISHHFDNLREHPYQLYAVFMHNGENASFGHYFIYIFDHRRGVWRKYNDTEVTEVKDTEEIFGARNDESTATPYLLAYVDKNRLDEMVDPLCRDVQGDSNPLGSDPMDIDS